MSDQMKVFIGTDRSQLLAAKVLEHSIRATASQDVQVQTMEKLSIPEPKDLRHTQRTGFSFSRWALPELCAYQGRAIYLDADMLVFEDICYLWNLPMGEATIALVDGTDNQYCASSSKLNKNESSVMVVDCARAKWSLQELVQGLDGRYTYTQMMSDLCFLREQDIMRNIPRRWNSMDYWNPEVALLHFTNVPTQPWVSVKNPCGHVWVEYLKEMLKESAISIQEIAQEVELGYVRPSLLTEIHTETCDEPESSYAEQLQQFDMKKKFEPHREVMEWNRKRARAIQVYELELAKQQGWGAYLKHMAKRLRVLTSIY